MLIRIHIQSIYFSLPCSYLWRRLFRSSITVWTQSLSFRESYLEWVDSFRCPISLMLTAITFWTNLSTMLEAPTAGFSSHFELWPGQIKLLPAIQSHIGKWFLLSCATYLHLHDYLSIAIVCARFSSHSEFDMPHLSGNKSRIPKGPFHILMFFPQNKWWRHLNYRKDRVIHQAMIKAFYWSQHYRAVFLRDDREGEWNLLKTNLSQRIIFYLYDDLAVKDTRSKTSY